MARVLPLLLAFLLCACASKEIAEHVQDPPSCPKVWVYAPDSFIVELAANSRVYLDPRVQSFPLFCTKEEAKAQLTKRFGTTAGWAFYTLDGLFEDLAYEDDGQYFLKQKAALRSWDH